MNALTTIRYSEDQRERIVDHVCAEITKKRFVSSILAEDEGMPSSPTFYGWLGENEEWSNKVARAREFGMEAHVEDMIAIADNATDDVYIEYDKNDNPVAKIDGSAIQRAKVQIYAREKAAQMLSPKRFGAKLDLTSGGKELPAPVNNTLIQDNRVQSLLAIAADRKARGEIPSLEDEKRKLLDD